MSSHTSQRHKRKSRGSSSSSAFSLWSNWKWNTERKEWESYRTNARGETEWQYKPGQSTSGAYAGSNVPRFDDASLLDPVSENTTQYSVNRSYTTGNNDVGSLTNSLAATTLTSIANLDPPIVAKLGQKNTSTEHRNFDENYKVHGKREFKFGRVFKVLWSEPSGNASGGTFWSVRQRKHGEEIYAKVRRFVIIHPRSGHCLCLPIMSYGGRATAKPGVHVEEHAIIHTTPDARLVEGEDINKMGYGPVRMLPDSTRNYLDASSRINYCKVYTVEYNVKVWFIGRVHRDSEKTVARSYNEANPPLRLSPQSSASGSYRENDPAYSNSPRAMPGTSSNITGYPTFSSQPNIPIYGNTMSRSTPSYGTMSRSTPSYGTGYNINTGSGSSNLHGGYSTARQNPQTQYTPSLYPLSQHPPSQYLPSQYPQYHQYPLYKPDTNPQNYNPQAKYKFSGEDFNDTTRYSDGQS